MNTIDRIDHTRDSSTQLSREILAAEQLLANLNINAPTSPLYASQLAQRIERLKENLAVAETDERTSALRIELSAALTERDALAERTAKIAELDKIIADLRQRKESAEQQEQRQQREQVSAMLSSAKSEWLLAIRQAARAYRAFLNARARAGQLGVQPAHDPHLLRFDGPLLGRSWQGTLGEAMQNGAMPFEMDTIEEKAA